jgi:hypothetical protein
LGREPGNPASRRRLSAVIGALLALLFVSCGRRADPLPGFPGLVLWAWERPEHLGFIDPHTTAVAFLARSINWRSGRVDSRPRYQPLEVPPETAVIAVTRLDAGPPPLPDAEPIAREIVETAAMPRVRAVQIDFDARLSERGWYASLLHRVRQRLPGSIPLTITALASWCQRDTWIRDLPVGDAVPMLFRMGAGEPRGVTDFSLAVCRSSLGVSTDEFPTTLPRGRRVFVFHPRPWTREAYRAAIEIVRKWR